MAENCQSLDGERRAGDGPKIDLLCIKSAMQMRELRCKTLELVRKEVWAHILAYNLIRTVMAQAAATHDVLPQSISFTGTMQTLEAFQPLLAGRAVCDRVSDLCALGTSACAHVEVTDARNAQFVQESCNGNAC
jgi:hypothetical protein